MEKIQVYLPTPTFKELKALMEESGFNKESEFGKHIIMEWITLRKYGIIKAAGGLSAGG